MSLGLAKRFPQLCFVIQDLAPMMEQAEGVWRRELPDAIQTGRTRLMPHNIFAEQRVKDAEVYFMRYLLFVPSPALLYLLVSSHPKLVTTGQTMNVSPFSSTFVKPWGPIPAS